MASPFPSALLLSLLALSAAKVYAQDEAEPAEAPASAEPAPAPEAEAPAEKPAAEAPAAAPAPAAPAPGKIQGHSATRHALEAAKDAPAAAPAAGDAIHLRKRSVDDRLFGSYRVRVGASRPNFDDGIKGYKELYGTARAFPMLEASWFPLDWYATIGLSLRFGYYAADGYAAQGGATNVNAKDLKASDIRQDKNGPTSLTLIPLQIAAAAEFTPFDRKWVVLDAWLGVENLYWQEVRTQNATTTGTTATPSTGSNSTTSTDDALVNKGSKRETAIGVAANILLNPLDEETVRSSRGTLGIQSVYLSPYLQIVRTLAKEGVSFGRTELGVSFTFETAR